MLSFDIPIGKVRSIIHIIGPYELLLHVADLDFIDQLGSIPIVAKQRMYVEKEMVFGPRVFLQFGSTY